MIIKDPALRKSLLRALADEPSAQILAATAYRPKSVPDLVKEEGLPSSSAYRRVHELEAQGLLVVARTIVNPDGKSYKMYRATFGEISVRFQAGEVLVTATPNMDVVQKAYRLFRSFSGDLEDG